MELLGFPWIHWGRIGAFQWVRANPNKKNLSALPLPENGPVNGRLISDNLDRITQIPFQTKNLFRKIAARGAGAAGTGKREQATYGNVGGRHSPLGNLVTPPPTQCCAQSAMFRRVGGRAPPHYRSLTRNRAIRDTGDMQLAHRRRRDRDAELCSHQRDHQGDLRSHFNDHGLVPGSNPAFRHAPTFGVVDRRADRTWKQQKRIRPQRREIDCQSRRGGMVGR